MNDQGKQPVTIERWGKDHWTTLLYVESRVVDWRGALDARHLRKDGYQYPTRLRDSGGLVGHNDIDCLHDMVAAGLLDITSSEGNNLQLKVRLTDQGWRVAAAARRHKADHGGYWQEFDWRSAFE